MSRDDIYLEFFGMVFRHQAYILAVLTILLKDEPEARQVRDVADKWMELADVCSTKEDSK